MKFQHLSTRLFGIATIILLFFFCQLGIVSADDEQESGVLTSFQTFTLGSDDHSSFLGKITVKEKNGNSSEYAWGGSACTFTDLTEAQQNFLVQVLTSSRNPHKLIITPFTKPGQGGNVCIVSYIISKSNFLALF